MTAPETNSANAEPGTVVGGRYRIERRLGEGGMATVFRAVHTETERVVALKLVKKELAVDVVARDLFVREARVAARIGRHEHVVDVLDAGVDDALGVPFLVMELLDGEPLDVRLKQGPIPREQALVWLAELGDALDQAHAAGVVHRDLKPQNLFIVRTRKGGEHLKVLDFGIAKLTEAAQSAQAATQIGTPAYAAPEQLGPAWRQIAEGRGRVVSDQVTPATDVWALGLVAFEMFTGARSGDLWGATTLAELPVKIVLEPPPRATERAGARAVLLPSGFDAWLGRCLELDARARFPSAGAAIAALTAQVGASAPAAALEPVAPRPPGRTQVLAESTPPASPLGSTTPHLPTAQSASQPPVRVSSQPPAPTGPLSGAPTPSSPAPSGPAPSAPRPGAPMPAAPPHAHAGPPQGAWPAAGWVGASWSEPIDPRVVAWAHARGVELRGAPDAGAFHAAQPFQFIPRLGRVRRELRVRVGEGSAIVGEIESTEELSRAVGEATFLLALVSSPRARYRVALRSKQMLGIGDSLSRGMKLLDGLVAAAPVEPAVLGDPWFESRFVVRAPSGHEAQLALPTAARATLYNLDLRGALETRPGLVAVAALSNARFDPPSLERLLDIAARFVASIG